MKAAVLHELGKAPVCQDIPDPVPEHDEQVILNVKASAIKNLDRARASGKHYASYKQLPVVVGMDGAGILEDGTRVYARGIGGMIAEKALIPRNSYTVLPANIDFVTAAALPNAILGSAMPLIFRARMKKGDVVLISGATGVTGQVALQLAKYYQAGKIIATGRNPSLLEKLKSLGADAVISLLQDDEAIVKTINDHHKDAPIDVVLDYLWGRPMELIIKALSGSGLATTSYPTRMITVGSIAGENIVLPSASLRSADIKLLGSGFGSLSQVEFEKMDSQILPEMLKLAAEGNLEVDIETERLENIEHAWLRHIEPGKRLVVTIS